MTENTGAEGTTKSTPAGESANDETLSNADVKASPLFQKLASELKEMRAADEARRIEDDAAKQAAEIKKLESEGKYSDAIKARDAELETVKQSHTKQLLEMSLTSEMIKAGFINDNFIKGALTQYNDEQTISEYVEALTNDEGNKPFLAAAIGRQRHDAPGAPKITGKTGALTVQEIREMQRQDADGGSLEQREKVRAYLLKHYEQHGALPEGL